MFLLVKDMASQVHTVLAWISTLYGKLHHVRHCAGSGRQISISTTSCSSMLAVTRRPCSQRCSPPKVGCPHGNVPGACNIILGTFVSDVLPFIYIYTII